MLSPPPFSPPLAFKNQALPLPWQPCRADLLLPAGHRYSTWAISGRLLWLWFLLSGCHGAHSHMLHGPRDAHVVLGEAKQGAPILFPAPHPYGSCTFQGFRAHGYLPPGVLRNGAFQEPTAFPLHYLHTGRTPRWPGGDKCIPAVREWADFHLTLRDEN